MATWRKGDGVMHYTFAFGIPTPRWLDRSTSRFARRLNLLRITRSRYTERNPTEEATMAEEYSEADMIRDIERRRTLRQQHCPHAQGFGRYDNFPGVLKCAECGLEKPDPRADGVARPRPLG